MSLTESTIYRRLLVATLLVGLVVFYWGLGDIALLSLNEARRAIPATGMFVSGDWLLPRMNGELYLSKPPLIYWLSASFAHLRGAADEWAVRLPSALAATAVLVVCYRFARKHFGKWPALFTLQILIANAGFAMFARRAEIEMVLAALCTGALLAALHYSRGEGSRTWLWLSYFLLGLAVLTKGPLALLFVTLPLLADAFCSREQRQWSVLKDGWGWCIFLVVGLSWYLVVSLHLGFGIWQATVERDMVHKMQSAASGEPFFNYVLWLVADFFPVSLLFFLAPLVTWRRWKMRGDLFALLLAVLIPLLIYSAFSDKHAKYLLPLYPVLAILLGVRLAEIMEKSGVMVRRLILTAGLLLPIGYAVFYGVVEARVFDYRVSVFPQFKGWLQSTGTNRIYAYEDLDERLIYYAERDIKSLDQSALNALRESHTPLLLLVENARVAEVRALADCQVHEFTPYLKKHKSLVVFGFAEACPQGPAK